MEKEHGYWIDENNNSWDANQYTEEQATKYSKSLVSCYDCINCKNCKKCGLCLDCKDCRYCTGCEYLKQRSFIKERRTE